MHPSWVDSDSGVFSLQLGALLLGFGNGLGAGTMMTLGADLAPSRSRGEFIGIWRFIGDGGSVGGPLIVGTVAEVLDDFMVFVPHRTGVAFLLSGGAIEVEFGIGAAG